MQISRSTGRIALLALALAFNHGSMWAKDLVIGQVAPFGGNLAVAGRDFNLGALIAIDGPGGGAREP